MQFGIGGFDNREVCIALVAKDTTSVRHPRHLYPIAGLQIVDMYAIGVECRTLHIRARSQRSDIRLPIGIAKELRQQTERGTSRSVRTIDITPQTFERGGRDMFVQTLPYNAREELKIVGRTNPAFLRSRYPSARLIFPVLTCS